MSSFIQLETLDQLKLGFFTETETVDTIKTTESNLLIKDVKNSIFLLI